ncbi:hypothetical protein BKA83DRAFT_12680 [Pisolithus microcarpus]|nr:hypothetical protein BKA83DRAFT_12680 [Pisolithus microcarpus]
MGDTDVYSSSHEQPTLTLRRTKWSTAGQGGAIVQLGKVGDALVQPQQTPRQQVALLDNAPWNALALTPHCKRKVPQPSQKGRSCKNAVAETHTEDSGIEPTDVTTGPQPEFQRAKPGARFSFQVQYPMQPSFPLSTVPEVPSASSIPDVAASPTTLSSPLKKLTGKSSLKPFQAAQQVIHPSLNAFRTNDGASDDLSTPNSAEEPHESDRGAWASPEDAADEDTSGHANNDEIFDTGIDDNRWSSPPANEELNGHHDDLCLSSEEMDVRRHEIDDESDNHFGTPSPQQRASPSPQTHSQWSSSQQQPPQPHLHAQPIASSQHVPLEKSIPRHIGFMWSGPAPSQQSRPQGAPNRAQDPPLPHSLGQHQESVSSNQFVLTQDHRAWSNDGPQQHGNEQVIKCIATLLYLHYQQIGMDYNINASHHS